MDNEFNMKLWGIMWRSDNRLDGKTRRLQHVPEKWPTVFRTRREAREFIEKRWGYIRTRPDLRKEPHGWKIPIPVKVELGLAEGERNG